MTILFSPYRLIHRANEAPPLIIRYIYIYIFLSSHLHYILCNCQNLISHEKRHGRSAGGDTRHDRRPDLPGLSPDSRRHRRRLRLLDGRDVRRRHCHAGDRPQGWPLDDGASRSFGAAHRTAHHTDSPGARQDAGLGGPGAQFVQATRLQGAAAQTLSQMPVSLRRCVIV